MLARLHARISAYDHRSRVEAARELGVHMCMCIGRVDDKSVRAAELGLDAQVNMSRRLPCTPCEA